MFQLLDFVFKDFFLSSCYVCDSFDAFLQLFCVLHPTHYFLHSNVSYRLISTRLNHLNLGRVFLYLTSSKIIVINYAFVDPPEILGLSVFGYFLFFALKSCIDEISRVQYSE